MYALGKLPPHQRPIHGHLGVRHCQSPLPEPVFLSSRFPWPSFYLLRFFFLLSVS